MKTVQFYVLIIFSIAFNAYGQTEKSPFASMKDLVGLMKKKNSEIEEILNLKGLKFNKIITSENSNNGEYMCFSNPSGMDYFCYSSRPRRIAYNFNDRLFYVNASDELVRMGFKGPVKTDMIDVDGKESSGSLFEKGNIRVVLGYYEESKIYRILIQKSDSRVSSGSGNNYNHSYFGLTGGILLPQGVFAESPDINASFTDDYNSLSGMGATKGYCVSGSGFIALNSLNARLPNLLGLGFKMSGFGTFQPFSYDELGSPYDDYTCDRFSRFGLGVGPAISLANSEGLQFVSFFEVQPSFCGGGELKYDGSDSFFYHTILRKESGVTLGMHTGFEFSIKNFVLGMGYMWYTDEATFESDDSFNGTQIVNSNLKINQVSLSLGLRFF